ncbi:hypothetical protein CANARDRAFT_173781 [[Candida] arabinofermentans NRRL YB-2248]|uniref:Agmatinase n=1 Tax=[Candida] arabinofermentans NRRL YB-2248 TaxID=983967 RepID=A0A1E4T802_9ASCO|nr:hypothetical protein CANARDRAFT_173781 [[Candida] arabinofermentans NRRL YB-2248]
MTPLITVDDVKNYEETKHKFLEEFYQVDQEQNALKFDTHVDLPINLKRLTTSTVQYPDKDDTSDLFPGMSDRYHGNALAGFLTFAHTPMESHCFDSNSLESVEYDIAIVGAPYDTGVSYRPGARYGPDGIRSATRRLGATYSPFRPGFNVFNNWAKIVDCGNAPMTPIDNRIALDQLYRAERASLKHMTTEKNPGKHPRIMTLGGDHTITFSAIRAAYEKYGKVSVIHFDSHLDTVDPYHMNKNVTDYAALNHGTFLYWAHRKGYLTDTNMHVGLRGWYEEPDDPKRDTTQSKFSKILARDIDSIGITGIIEKIKQRVGESYVYITFDIDVLDPAHAMATGTVEPGGFSTREALQILDGLQGLNVVGADICEVSPPFDVSEVTTQTAGEVVRSLLALMVLKPVV